MIPQLCGLYSIIKSLCYYIQVGDLYVAEDVVTKKRRLVENIDKVIGEGRQVLKG